MSVPSAKPLKTKSKSAAAPAPALALAGGFDWSGTAAASPAHDSGSDSDDEPDLPESSTNATKSKSKSKSRTNGAAPVDLTSTAPDLQPSSSSEFERALLSSPNSSYLWIQYMSFHLQLHEIDQARKIGRKALEKMNYREEEEKSNVWMALVNLEIGFGTEETMEKVFKEAAQYNDGKTVYARYAEALQAAGKDEVSVSLFEQSDKLRS
jgi:rRNA biogenesis protein RRP5